MKVTENVIKRVATEFKKPAAKIGAVFETEASQGPFRSDGFPVILFEPHLFDSFTGGKYRKSHPHLSTESWKKTKEIGTYNKDARKLFNEALLLNANAAIKATSWGLGQILGMNYKAAGFDVKDKDGKTSETLSLQAFVNAMRESEYKQAVAMMKFILFNPALEKAFDIGDWNTFAKIYNGPGYKENKYDEIIAANFEKMKKIVQENPGKSGITLLGLMLLIGIVISS